jgi:hypothetical protein
MIKKILACSLFAILLSSSSLEEGMFPLSDISKIDLAKAGLKIPVSEIYNPNSTSLVQALVRVGGCTGSFVSESGLIITNHHCAFGAVAAASTKEKDYIAPGLNERSGEKRVEIPTGITARITESYEDISAKVLDGVFNVADELKSDRITANIRSITEQEEKKHPGLLIEVSEMLQGKSYTLFRYRELKDIRLVYVPERSIGEFGGESDNWVWPRHTGDFAFMRAYVAPDGSAAAYAPENVPYRPKQFLRVNPEGVKENDFVFILGYPGRTFRNQPSQFLEYQYQHVLPYISTWYDFQINSMQKIAAGDKSKEIAFASRIKSLANVSKNYRGKLQGLNRTSVIQDRKADDEAMKKMIAADPELEKKFGHVFRSIENIYSDKMSTAAKDLWLSQVFGSSGILYAAGFIGNEQAAFNVLEKQDKKKYLDGLGSEKLPLLRKGYHIYDPELEKTLIRKLMLDGIALPENQRPKVLDIFVKAKDPTAAVDEWLAKAFDRSLLVNPTEVLGTLEANPEKMLKKQDAFMQLGSRLWKELQEAQIKERVRQNQLTVLLPELTEIRLMYKKASFVPDANSTLRFTYGYIKGYFPADADYHHPFTSIRGVLEKAAASGDYFLEDYIRELLQTEDPAGAVCILYNMDTTGGNSGSPILDANGYLIGVNFDRAFTATINDFAWNEEYSRSIGVDIRYVLLIMKKLAKADDLLHEMGVS